MLMKGKLLFQKLTPADDIDLTVYEDAFDYIFHNADIKNVAISGPYGAGKSSILETYKKNHLDKNFLHISLAHFENELYNNTAPNDSQSKESIEAILEGKILNQLLQQIDEKSIPQTGFHVKRAVSDFKCIRITMGIIVFILALLHLVYCKAWTNWVSSYDFGKLNSLLLRTTHPISRIISGFIVIVLLGFGIFMLLRVQKNRNILRKFSLQGNEIELFSENENSYFDKYLNEVLYIFENADVDVIVFEDLDRNNDTEVFKRLREMNTLVNLRLQKSKGRHARNRTLQFFYLLRDDIFKSKDRTKFFDFILPVIPVLDSSNSYNQLKKYFDESNIYSIFEEKFLRDLSLYIDDIRILKNIINEFNIYYNKLSIIELNPNKMLAIITYKNLFPRDFSLLQLNQGYIYTVFKYKNIYIKNEKEEYEKKIIEIEEEILKIKQEFLNSLEELEDVKAAKNKRIGILDNIAKEAYKKWEREEYPLRKQIIEEKQHGKIDELESSKFYYQERKLSIESKKLCEIITKDNIDTVFFLSQTDVLGNKNKFKSVIESEYFDLLKFLVLRGYIDESYSDYMTYFYENNLTIGDKKFLRSIIDKKPRGYTYALDNAKVVFSHLDINDLRKEETLNFNLFEYLLQEGHDEGLLNYIYQINNRNRFSFIGEFFEINREREKLVHALNKYWPEFWGKILKCTELSEDQIRRYSIYALIYTDNAGLEKINKDNCLTDYISMQKNYLSMEIPDTQKMIDALRTLKVAFVEINLQQCNQDLLQAVYQYSLYELNMKNIKLMLAMEYDITIQEGVIENCVSLIFSKPEQPMCIYAKENMDFLLTNILEEIRNYNDTEETILYIINCQEISKEHKLSYIKKLNGVINNIKSIQDELYWDELVRQKKVQYIADNIIEYYNLRGLTAELVEFINSQDEKLDYNATKTNSQVLDRFWSSCITCKDLTNPKYIEIYNAAEPVYLEFNLADVPKDKMDILVQKKVIPMTEKTLVFMRRKYPDNKMNYIRENISQYKNIAVGNLISVEEIEEILTWDIPIEWAKSLLSRVNKKISVVTRTYNDEIMAEILKNNLNLGDLTILYQKFEDYGTATQQVIEKLASGNFTNVIAHSKNVSTTLAIALLKYENVINLEERINMFVAFLERFTINECIEGLSLLELEGIAKLVKDSVPIQVEINSINQKVLEALKTCGYIKELTEDQETNMFRAVANNNSFS